MTLNLPLHVAAVLLLVLVAPLTVWAERRVKAWTQLRRGPGPLQPYRDLRRLFAKEPLAPATASPLFLAAPWLGAAAVLGAAYLLPLSGPAPGAAPLALLAIAPLLALHRLLLAGQGYDTATAFGGIGSSRELFLGGLGEPVLLLAVAATYLVTGGLGIPASPLPWDAPSTWLLAASFALLWIAEAARIPFDNPATHLELTMVHEAMILEASGWVLALHEWAAALKQTLLAALLVLLVVPLPAPGLVRPLAVAGAAVAASAALALAEAGTAKFRLFRATHLLFAAALLAFLGGAVALLGGGAA